ncbi:hypothetical protein [Aeoliella sp. SH292]|uniref:hypothetical protein n=1 Tax=Aeoliella sp. SH292 TaxID=3454464 RepID=UPI003F9D49F5
MQSGVSSRTGGRYLAWSALLVCSVVSVGCDSKNSSAPARPPRDVSPEAKYQRLVLELERILSADPKMTGGRTIMPGEAGSATSTTRYSIAAPKSVLIPKDGSAPQVSVEITKTTTFSFLPAPKKSQEESEGTEAESSDPRNDNMGELNSNLKEMGVEVLDPEKLKSDLEKAAGSRITPPAMSQTVNTEKHVTYELIYENDRWRLARPPAADALESTNIAIQQALQRQL